MLKSSLSYLMLPVLLLASTLALAAVQTDEVVIEKLTSLHAQADRFLEEDKCHQALVIYDEILLIEPDDEVAYTNAGYCQMLLGQFEKAEDSFKNALHINPDNDVAEMGLRKLKDPDGDWQSSND